MDDEPRRVAPQPTASQSAIPQPVVPEVTLLWDGEESVYWRPNTPGSVKAAAHPLSSVLPFAGGAVGRPRMAGSMGVVAAPATRVNAPNGALSRSVGCGSQTQYAATGAQATAAPQRAMPPTAMGAPSDVTDSFPDGGTVSSGSSGATAVCSRASSLAAGILLGKRTSPQIQQVNLMSEGHQRDVGQGQGQVHEIIQQRALANQQVYSQQINQQHIQSQVSRQSSLSHAEITATEHRLITQQQGLSEESEGLPCSSQCTAHLTDSPIANQHETQSYNPLMYSSEKKPKPSNIILQRRNINNEQQTTPVLTRNPKTIIPRSVDFYDATPITVNVRNRVLDNNKENISPDQLIHKRNTQLINATTNDSPGSRNSSQMVTCNATSLDSPQSYINSPDPFLCKIIEGKDQQIFQLHKVLDTVLSRQDSAERSSSVSSSGKQSPKKEKIAITQTSFCEDTRPETRSIGVNTDFTWASLMESVSRYCSAGCEPEDEPLMGTESKPYTILKSSSARKSSLIMQKSSNNSSVRFEACAKTIGRTENYIAEPQNKPPANMYRGNDAYYQRGNPVDHRTATEKTCGHCGNANRLERGVNNTDGATHDQNYIMGFAEDLKALDAHANRPRHLHGDNAAGYNVANEFNNMPDSNGGCAGPTNHREVSLTLREVVLTTIQEDPVSPQQSLHLDLPDYNGGDTVHQVLRNRLQQPSVPKHGYSSPAACNGWENNPPVSGVGHQVRVQQQEQLQHQHQTESCEIRSHAHDAVNYTREDAYHRHGQVAHQLLGEQKHDREHACSGQHDHNREDVRVDDSPRTPDGNDRAYAPVGGRPGTPYAHRAGARDAVPRGPGDQCRGRRRGDGDQESAGGPHLGNGTGVTIYRNLMNNLQQILQDPTDQQQRGGAASQQRQHSPASGDQQLDALQRQLQQFGLSFIEPRTLAPRGNRPEQTARQAAPLSLPGGVESLLSLYRANAIAAPPHAPVPGSAQPIEFSIATTEFLRNNGLLMTE